VNILCNQNAPTIFYNPLVIDESNPCIPVVQFESSTGCAIEISYLWTWITDNDWVMFAFSVVIGILFCFFGLKLYKPIFFISGTLLTIGIILLLFYSTFLKSTTESWVPWVVLAGSLLVGLLVGFIVMKISILGAFVLAFIGGYVGALLLWNTFLYLTTTSDALFYSFTFGIAFICGVLALIFFDHCVILGSAMFGSFFVIAGIGIVAGGYANPFTIGKTIQDGETIEPTFYAYLVGNVILFIIGAAVQYHMRKKANEYKHPYHNLR
jgi:MFS family permease